MDTLIRSSLFVLLFFSSGLYAQQFYSKVSLGYGFSVSPQLIGTNSSFIVNTYTNPGSDVEFPRITTSEQNSYGSYGAGKNVQLSAGIMLSDNVGIEAMVGYGVGNKYTTRSVTRESRLNEMVTESRAIQSYQSHSFTFSPMFKLSLSETNVTPYVMVGPLFGKIGLSEEQTNVQQDEQGRSLEETRTEYRGGISIGSRALVGVEWKVRDRVSLFTDLIVSQLSFFPTSSKMISYKINGEDNLEMVPLKNRKVVYKNNVTYDSSNSTNPDSPSEAPRINYVMNSLSVNIGAKFTF